MSYGLFLHKEIITLGDRVARVEIYYDGYTGESEEIEALGSTPFLLSFDNSGEDLRTPIIKTLFTLNIVDTGQIDYSIFYTNNPFKFGLTYKLDGVVQGTWFLTPESFSQSLVNKSVITLVFRDNIGLWDTTKFNMAGERNTLGAVLTEGLSLVNFAFTVDNLTKKNGVYSSWVFDNIFEGIVEYGHLKEKTWLEVIEAFFKSIAVQFRYTSANTYSIIDIGYLYELEGSTTAKPFIFSEQSGFMEILPAWKSVTVTQDYGYTDSIYKGLDTFTFHETKTVNGISTSYYYPNTENWSGSVNLLRPSDWLRGNTDILLTGKVAGYGMRPSIVYEQTIDDITSGIDITFNISNVIFKPVNYRRVNRLVPYLRSSDYQLWYFFNVFFEDGNGIKVMREEWETYTGEVEYIRIYPELSGTNSVSSDYTGIEKMQEFTINVLGLPGAGLLRFAIYPYYSPSFSSGEAYFYDGVVRISDIKMTVTGEGKEADDIKVVIDSNNTIEEEINIEVGQVPLYMGNNLTFKNGIFKNTTLFPPYNLWFRMPNSSNTKSLTTLVYEEIIHHYRYTRKKISGTIMISGRTQMPDFGTYYLGTDKYVLNFAELDIANEAMTVEMIQVRAYVETTTTTSTSTTSTTSTSTSTTSTTSTTILQGTLTINWADALGEIYLGDVKIGTTILEQISIDATRAIYRVPSTLFGNYAVAVNASQTSGNNIQAFDSDGASTGDFDMTNGEFDDYVFGIGIIDTRDYLVRIYETGTTTTSTTSTTTTTSTSTTTTTTEPPVTTTSTTSTSTTSTSTTTTTTQAPREEVLYYGYDASNISACFYSNITGSFFGTTSPTIAYRYATGEEVVPDGYYMLEKNSGVEDSIIIYILNGVPQ